ncbi:hypothetical protein FB446DRAFT_750066 [Lentinula raphanica]|nr:hypothetical protein FB446DRAFT_750066 [Lentinula raphanica]
MKRTLGAGMDKTTNKETGMGIAMDSERNPKKRKIVNEGVDAEVDAEGGGPLNVNKNEIRDGVEKPASLKVEADTEGWTKVGKKSKKTKKEKKKIESQIPRFMYSNGDIVKRQHAVGVEEIRDLAIHLLLHEGRPPSFIRIEHTERIAKVVILLVPGITPDVLNINIEAGTLKNPNLPMTIPFAAGFIPNTFSHACPTRAPGDQSRMFSVLGTFLNVRVSGGKGHAKDKRNAKGKGKGKPIEEYMLTIDQMVQNGYPVPSYLQGGSKREEGEGWVETPMEEGEGEKKGRKAYGIDCEMVLTEDGKKSLARVCMVDYETGVVAYDTLVKSDQKVVDYLTRWSGITEEKLSNATTTFAEAQAAILSLLSSQSLTPILIGHSLESDLKSLKISHPFCIDTSLLYAHPRGRSFKPGLAWLTKKWCGREIQTEGGGHDPEEDARAAIELVREKIKNGPSFGVEHEELFDLLGRKNVRTAFVDRGTPAQSQTSTHTQISCTGDDEVVENIVSVVPQSGFILGRLLGLAESRGWVTPRSGDTDEEVKVELQNDNTETVNVHDEEPSLSSSLQETSTRLRTIYSSLPTNTALLVFSGHQDPRRMGDLSKRRARWEKEMKARVGRAQGGSEQGQVGVEGARWTTADMRELESEVELAKKGLLFLGVKP